MWNSPCFLWQESCQQTMCLASRIGSEQSMNLWTIHFDLILRSLSQHSPCDSWILYQIIVKWLYSLTKLLRILCTSKLMTAISNASTHLAEIGFVNRNIYYGLICIHANCRGDRPMKELSLTGSIDKKKIYLLKICQAMHHNNHRSYNMIYSEFRRPS